MIQKQHPPQPYMPVMDKSNYFTRLFLTALLLATLCHVAYASSFKPIVTNFSSRDYGLEAGIQNWDCAQGKNGEMYIGNNKGLLIYDGYFWEKVSIPGEIIVRSLLVDGDRIYIGSYEEFGFFTYNDMGDIVYQSLRKDLQGFEMENDEIWNILKVNGKIYFQSFRSAFVYDGEKVNAIYDPEHPPLYFHFVNGRIYAQIIYGGYCIFDGKTYKEAFPRTAFGDDNIVAALQLKGGKAILCSESHGLFEMQGNSIAKRQTEIDKELTHGRINRAILTKDSTIVIGTLLNGIYAIGMDGKLKWHYNVESGLNNNSVLRLFCDRDNNIWAALDNGIALIHSGAPYSIMIPERDETQLGMIYSIGIVGNRMYLATNQGLYSYKMDTGKISFIDGTGGQNWHVTTFGSQTFAGYNNCTFEIEEETTTAIPTASSTCMKRCNIHGQDIILESSYSTLNIYKQVAGRWRFSHSVEGFLAPIRTLEVDQSGTIWAANMNRGVYRVELSSDLKRLANKTYLKNLSDSIPTINYIMKIRGRIVFSDNKQLYTYDDMEHRVIPYKLLNDALESTKNIHDCTPVDDKTFWLSSKQEYILMKYENDKFKTVLHIPVFFFGVQNNDSNGSVYIRGNVAYFTLNNGVAKFSFGKGAGNRWVVPQLRLISASFAEQDDKQQQLPINGTAYSDTETDGNISFRFSFPNYNKENISFKFFLSGKTDLTTERSTPEITYNNLGYGDYNLEVQAVDPGGKIIGTCSYQFTVPRPFYLSTLAFFLYIILLTASIYGITKWQTNRNLRKREIEYEAERNIQNIKMLEQEKLIAQQQQQLLESELSAKSKEVASLALNVYTKEKVLEGLKDSIYMQKVKGGISQKEMDVLLKKIESDSGNMEFWDIYQKNFDLIHDHFFRNLRERFPSLTASDLKFCALLRLNLSTKDIAKFTNLTIRGVEAARYRLRKKLGLSEKTSLIEFLIDFK